MSNLNNFLFRMAFACLLTAAFSGCSNTDNKAGFDTQTGKHVANWINDHGSAYLSDQTVCSECHGADLRGGIASVSCFSGSLGGVSCHANGLGHTNPTAYGNPAQHGVSAKSAPNPASMSGFFVCQLCHGIAYQGGTASPACKSCHGGTANAPHPTSWLTGTYVHTNTDGGNAAVCAQCHANGLNSPLPPPTPTPASGTPPGCFNNTLCHGTAGHPAGWSVPAQHGTSAKAAPNASAMQGFSTCRNCHGANFSGSGSIPACSSCHNGSAPHPVSWITGTYVHTNTDTGNAQVCSLCHLNGANSPTVPPSPPAPAGTAPGCFNNTLCHGAAVHSTGWSAAARHGASAKAAPNVATMSGFNTCRTCHGTDFSGGSANTACASCHGINAPHPASWVGQHDSTNQANAAVCALCHRNNNPGTPGCLNNTLCHGSNPG